MNNKDEINKMYEEIADELNIPNSVFESANNSYKALGEYLENNIDYKLTVFPQGSMNLGTLIKPISDDDDYDLDAVCKVFNDFKDPKLLKKLIGDALMNSGIYKKMLQPEGKRCWTLKYADETHFHMDILPASPNNENDRSIKITHKKEDNNYEYRISNPEGYAEWFDRLQEDERKRIYSTKKIDFSSKVEDLRKYDVRTTLQKTIQILKRHRDIKYLNANDKKRENKPISIIITTLVGKMYNGQESIIDLLLKFTDEYMNFIEVDSNGNYVIKNPVNESENFADKWILYPERKDAFFKWIDDLKMDLITNNFMSKEDLIEKSVYLKTIFGEKIISNVFEKRAKNTSKSYINREGVATLTTNKTDTEIKEHTFFGY